MEIHYLNLDRRPERKERFLRDNTAIGPCLHVSAEDGYTLTRDRLVAERVIEPDLANFSAGALGNAASHRGLWQRCIAQQRPLTIAEDDAVFNRHFHDSAAKALARLPIDWDIVFWGFNFDSILHVDLFDGLNEGIVHFTRAMLGADVAQYRERVIEPTPLRLINAFGLVCYSISPGGAAQLLERCFPLRNELILVPGLKAQVHNITLDTAMNRHFRSLQAYVCFPPIVWTENDRGQSDVCRAPQ